MDGLARGGTTTSTRRGVILKIGVFGCGAALLASVPGQAAAANKLKQKAASYQPTPKGKQRCDACKQWDGPAACKIVEGTISPSGWCILYAPK